MSRHLCQASRAQGGICLTPCWGPEKGRCAWVLGVYFAGQASRLPSKAKPITPRYLLWISSTVERKGLCLPPNNWLRQTSCAEAGASVAKPGAAACVCCLPWGAAAWAPWELLWPSTPTRVSKAAVWGAERSSPLPRSLRQAWEQVYKPHSLPGRRGFPSEGCPALPKWYCWSFPGTLGSPPSSRTGPG